jgi:hypothetical protein
MLRDLPDAVLERVAHLCLHSGLPVATLAAAAKPSPVRVRQLPEQNVRDFFAFAGQCRRMRAAAAACLSSVEIDCSVPPMPDARAGRAADRFRLVALSGGNLASLHLVATSLGHTQPDAWSSDCGGGAVAAALPRCGSLRELKLRSCRGAEEMIVDVVGGVHASQPGGARAPGARPAFPSLAHLTVEASRPVFARTFADRVLACLSGPAGHFPALSRLDLQATRYASRASLAAMLESPLGARLSHIRLGEPVAMDGAALCSMIAPRCSRLESLELYSWSPAAGASHRLCAELGPRLRSLALSACDWSDESFAVALADCADLASLAVTQCKVSADGLVGGILRTAAGASRAEPLRLRSLSLAGVRDWRDDHFLRLCASPPAVASLRKLSLVACGSSMTSEGLCAMLEMCGASLASLEVRSCGGLLSHGGSPILQSLCRRAGAHFSELTLTDYPPGLSAADVWRPLQVLGPRLASLHLSVGAASDVAALEHVTAACAGNMPPSARITFAVELGAVRGESAPARIEECLERLRRACPLARVTVVQRPHV